MPPPAPGTDRNLTTDFWVTKSVPVTSDERFTEPITRGSSHPDLVSQHSTLCLFLSPYYSMHTSKHFSTVLNKVKGPSQDSLGLDLGARFRVT